MKIKICLVLMTIFLLPVLVGAKQRILYQDYEVEINWHPRQDLEENNLLAIDGNIRKGAACKKLIISVIFSHEEIEGLNPLVRAEIMNYNPNNWNTFRGEQKISIETRHNKHSLWGYDGLNVNCVQP